jgi:hypothetical protein
VTYRGLSADEAATRYALLQSIKAKAATGEVPVFGGYDQGSPSRQPDPELGTDRFAGDALGSLGLNGKFGLATDQKENQDYFKKYTERQEGGPFALMPMPPPEGGPPPPETA